MKKQLHNSCRTGRTPCGCCAKSEALTPMPAANRPGLNSIAYRAGTHATFLETMKAALSRLCLGDDDDCRKGKGNYPLSDLTTRQSDDAALAMLDAWATVADVLTFYQERIANEGYLRTAIERRSVLELSRLVGYRARLGVASTVLLALTIDNGNDVVIEPFEVRAQSIPGPGELPQSFENVEKLDARAQWNKLQPRMSRPQKVQPILDTARTNSSVNIYLKGTTTGLNPNDPLLVVTGGQKELFRVIEVKPDAAADRTRVMVKSWLATTTLIGHAAHDNLIHIVSNPSNAGAAKAAFTALRSELNSAKSDAELADFVEQETIQTLERALARKNINAEAKEQLKGHITAFDEIVKTLRVSEASATGAVEDATALMSSSLPTGSNFLHLLDTEDALSIVVPNLTKLGSVPPASPQQLGRDPKELFKKNSDLGLQLFGTFRPELRDSITTALANTGAPPVGTMQVYALRVKAAPFGQSTPLRSEITETKSGSDENLKIKRQVTYSEWTAADINLTEETFKEGDDFLGNIIYLDGNYDKILPDSWVVVDTRAINPDKTKEVRAINGPLLIAQAGTVQTNISRAAYGISGKSTRIELTVAANSKKASAWITTFGKAPDETKGTPIDDFQVIRRTAVYAQSEKLDLAEEPIETPIGTKSQDTAPNRWIVLDGVYSELKSGRSLIVSGERDDIRDNESKKVGGVKACEVAMLSEVVHAPDPDDGTFLTRIKLAENLAYRYRRNDITIYANVIRATQGETRRETLGSGDSSRALQQFALRQTPLTYVSAPTPTGVESTLKIFVNDVRWHEADVLLGLSPTDRRYVTRVDNDDVTSATFGNGIQGARLPTGAENVRADYRQGLGKAGNVKAEKIALLTSRPLGVREVINPLRASGGADRDSRDQIRKNAPLGLMALDRLISTQDYASFAHVFAGVSKAYAVRVSDGRRELVNVTIAGTDDIPIDRTSNLFRNLILALRRFGDQALPLRLDVRELVLLIVSAKVRISPDYIWEKVEPKIRASLLDAFGFEKRELGQDALLSEVITAIQLVEGVAYVDVEAFGGVAERGSDGSVKTPKQILGEAQAIVSANKPDQRVRANLSELIGARIRPAQLVYLVPDVPDTLILNLV